MTGRAPGGTGGGREHRLGQRERLHAAPEGDLQAPVEQREAVLGVDGLAAGVDGDGAGVVGVRIPVPLALELVAGGQDVVRPERGVEPGLQGVGAAVVEAAPGGGLERSAAEGSVGVLAARVDGLIAGLPGDAGGGDVAHEGAPGDERRRAERVGVALVGDEGRGAGVERQALLEPRELGGGEGGGAHDAVGGKVGEHLGGERGALGDLQAVAGVPQTPGGREGRGEPVPHHALGRHAAVGVGAADPVAHVEHRHRGAVDEAVAGEPAPHAWQGAERAEPAPFHEDLPLRGAAAGAGRDVDDPGHGLYAIDGPGAV